MEFPSLIDFGLMSSKLKLRNAIKTKWGYVRRLLKAKVHWIFMASSNGYVNVFLYFVPSILSTLSGGCHLNIFDIGAAPQSKFFKSVPGWVKCNRNLAYHPRFRKKNYKNDLAGTTFENFLWKSNTENGQFGTKFSQKCYCSKIFLKMVPSVPFFYYVATKHHDLPK